MKLHLKIELIGDKSLKMTIIHICEEAMISSYSTGSKVFISPYTDISIWSYSDFIFDNKQIRLPQRDRLMSRLSHTYQFKSEEERHDVLKKYYHTFGDWASNTHLFPNTDRNYKKRVHINDKYWRII